ncbi:hypothetical protein CDAR_493981 [Caerostris darwini]|uniref:Uncharacterized protein n=1 Tax=Caerostris darwini TaxID=1538125 RepID=A0AAV4VSM5_9ARAC|nr:hypothetical protein CDAR_493981 [Caerostris darwini]
MEKPQFVIKLDNSNNKQKEKGKLRMVARKEPSTRSTVNKHGKSLTLESTLVKADSSEGRRLRLVSNDCTVYAFSEIDLSFVLTMNGLLEGRPQITQRHHRLVILVQTYFSLDFYFVV